MSKYVNIPFIAGADPYDDLSISMSGEIWFLRDKYGKVRIIRNTVGIKCVKIDTSS